jgi:hypothetical protein
VVEGSSLVIDAASPVSLPRISGAEVQDWKGTIISYRLFDGFMSQKSVSLNAALLEFTNRILGQNGTLDSDRRQLGTRNAG